MQSRQSHYTSTSSPPRIVLQTIWLVLIVGLGAGCMTSNPIRTSSGSLPDQFPHHTAADILERLPAYPASMSRLYAEARIALSSPEESGRFTAKIDYLHPESLLVRVTFPLGVEGARVLVTTDSAWVYDRIEKIVWTGSPERVAGMLPGAVAGLHLVELATGFEQPNRDGSWHVDTDSTLYLLTSKDGRLRYTIDPSLWRMVAIKEWDSDGTLLEQRWYSDFIEVQGETLPRRMALSRPGENMRISMAWHRIELQPDHLTFALKATSEAQRIDLGK